MTGDSEHQPPGKRLPPASLAMVAAHARVSVATVSRVINGIANKASEATADRVHKAIAELGYRPASVGRALRCQESRIVGVLAANLANPAMAAIASSIEWALRKSGLVMALCDTHERSDVQDEYLLEMQSQLARAIVLVGAADSRVLDDFRAARKTMVFVNRPDPGCIDSPYVGIDNYRAGADVVDALLTRGVRRFGLLHASLDRTAAFWRRSGILDRLAAAGIGEDDVVNATAEGIDHVAVGYQGMAAFLERPDAPRVIICLSDPLAYGACRRAREAGLRVPEDFAFFGFDDNPLNSWIAEWLNSVGVPAERYGPTVVAALRDLWRGHPPPGPIYLAHEVRVRNPRFPTA